MIKARVTKQTTFIKSKLSENPNFPPTSKATLKTLLKQENLTGLENAINKFTTYINNTDGIPIPETTNDTFDFYADLLPIISEWAVEGESFIGVETMPATMYCKRVISSIDVRNILANAFFLNDDDVAEEMAPYRYGSFRMNMIYFGGSMCVERVVCLLAYFYLNAYMDVEERMIEYERVSCEPVDWFELEDKIEVNVEVTDNAMEACSHDMFVDFANRFIHIHQIIPSLTQEEVLFTVCPEAYISIALFETILDNEAVIIRNVMRFCDYTGYLRTFRFTNMLSPVEPFDILVIDATISSQYSDKMLKRDMLKAYMGFKHGKVISTGHWGCGVFGGCKQLKFLQQVCAAALAGSDLVYSTFRDAEMKSQFESYVELLKGKSIKDVTRIMKLMPNVDRRDMHALVLEELQQL